MRYAILCLILTGCVTGFFAKIPEETGTIEVFFCDQVDCLAVFENKIASSSISCAMYNLNSDFLKVLEQNNAQLVVDEGHPVKNAVIENGNGLMHNKFCIINDKFVWTGSWNPSQENAVPNNVVVIESKTIANAYQREFDELHRGVFHGGPSHPGLVKLNGHLVEAYFCPEDDCQKHVIDTLETAQESIHFMTFAFTADEIGDLLVEKKNRGVDVQGIFDPRKNRHSEYEKLKDVSKVKQVHHKVFIIDGKIVITGSYNPSRNGNERNDENVIIIHDPAIAHLFENEFNRFI